jgi:hypothetical protein
LSFKPSDIERQLSLLTKQDFYGRVEVVIQKGVITVFNVSQTIKPNNDIGTTESSGFNITILK